MWVGCADCCISGGTPLLSLWFDLVFSVYSGSMSLYGIDSWSRGGLV